MRLPPRQSAAEADLMVPFQLVSQSEDKIISVVLVVKLIYLLACMTLLCSLFLLFSFLCTR